MIPTYLNYETKTFQGWARDVNIWVSYMLSFYIFHIWVSYMLSFYIFHLLYIRMGVLYIRTDLGGSAFINLLGFILALAENDLDIAQVKTHKLNSLQLVNM